MQRTKLSQSGSTLSASLLVCEYCGKKKADGVPMPTTSPQGRGVLHSSFPQLGVITNTPTNQKTLRFRLTRGFGIFTSVTRLRVEHGSFGKDKQDPICMEVGTDEFPFTVWPTSAS
jgi:hypothetical protein